MVLINNLKIPGNREYCQTRGGQDEGHSCPDNGLSASHIRSGESLPIFLFHFLRTPIC